MTDQINLNKCDQFTQGYVECALWASTDEQDPETGEGPPMDQEHDWHDIAPSDLSNMILDCHEFQKANQGDIDAACEMDASYDESRAGFDFWLTRNGHGAGFWDRGLGDVGDKLTKASEAYGDCCLFKGDGPDAQIHII
jgi:hypothetical protein